MRRLLFALSLLLSAIFLSEPTYILYSAVSGELGSYASFEACTAGAAAYSARSDDTARCVPSVRLNQARLVDLPEGMFPHLALICDSVLAINAVVAVEPSRCL